MTDPNGGFFTSGGAKSLNYGKTHDTTYLNKVRGGKITNVAPARQQTGMTDGKPVFQKDGVTPKNELPVTMECVGGGEMLKAAYANDPAVKQLIDTYGAPIREFSGDPADDGRRTCYVKGTLQYSIGEHMRKTGVDPSRFIAGGELYMIWVGMKKVANTEFDGRDWVVLYFPPAPQSQAGGFFDDQSSGAPAAPAQQTPPPAFGAQQPTETSNAAPPAGNAFGAAPAAQQPAQPPFGAPAPQAPAPAQSGSPWG